MTKEEAITILENGEWWEIISGVLPYDDVERMELQEAIHVAISALRARQTKLDRSRWEGCDCCKGDLEGYTAQFRDMEGRPRPLYIPEGEAMIVAPGKYNHRFCIQIKYCPFCGRPLTEEAWVETERRINSGTTD